MVTLVDKKMREDVLQMLELAETMDRLAQSNTVHCLGYVLRRDSSNLVRRALDFTVKLIRERSRPKNTSLRTFV